MRQCLAAQNLIGARRDEVMAVRLHPDAPVPAHADRSLLRPLGMWLTKVHVNGIVTAPRRAPRIWLSQRSLDATSAPGEWDTLVAGGGQSAGHDPTETARREGAEEAGLSRALCAGLACRGAQNLIHATALGLHREKTVVFDLDLPDDFAPVCRDGEVRDLRLLGLADMQGALAGGLPIKFSSAHVLRGVAVRLTQPAGASVMGGRA